MSDPVAAIQADIAERAFRREMAAARSRRRIADTPEAALARSLVAAGCAWELAALTSGRVPTLSSLVWRGTAAGTHGRLTMFALWLLVVAVGTDHFFIRRWS